MSWTTRCTSHERTKKLPQTGSRNGVYRPMRILFARTATKTVSKRRSAPPTMKIPGTSRMKGMSPIRSDNHGKTWKKAKYATIEELSSSSSSHVACTAVAPAAPLEDWRASVTPGSVTSGSPHEGTARRASSPTVRASYTSRTAMDAVVGSVRSMEISAAASSELPPRSLKKSSVIETSPVNASTFRAACAILRSTRVRGRMTSGSLRRLRLISTGKSLRHSFPPRLFGRSLIVSRSEGTMYLGRDSCNRCLTASRSGGFAGSKGTTWAARACSAPSPWTRQAASRTPSHRARQASIASSSTRYPRSLTCESMRPW